MKKAILGVKVSSGQREMSLNHDVTGLTPETFTACHLCHYKGA